MTHPLPPSPPVAVRAFHAAVRTAPIMIAACLACVAVTSRADGPGGDDAPHTVRLLTVGNSLSQDATRWLGHLARAAGRVLEREECVVGGASLEQHWRRAETFGRDPADPAGRYPTGKSLVEALESRPWDAVTIQQVSTLSHDPDTFQPHADRLVALIAEHAPTARVWLHETWEYRADSPRFTAPAAKPGEPRSAAEMYRGIREAYRVLADALDAPVIPAGDAFHMALRHERFRHRVDPSFDPARAEHPALPDQTGSLHVGWNWKTGDDGRWKLTLDDRHASVAGSYLAGCVWFESLFEESSVGNAFVPPGLDPATARALQEIAHRAVTARREQPVPAP